MLLGSTSKILGDVVEDFKRLTSVDRYLVHIYVLLFFSFIFLKEKDNFGFIPCAVYLKSFHGQSTE